MYKIAKMESCFWPKTGSSYFMMQKTWMRLSLTSQPFASRRIVSAEASQRERLENSTEVAMGPDT